MSEKPFIQHTGDDQLIHGLPKRMYAVKELSATPRNKERVEAAKAEPKGKQKHLMKAGQYWRFIPKPQACERCQQMKGIWFEDKPERPHPNCKCELVREIRIGLGAADAIVVPPGVDIRANLAEARKMKKTFELNPYARSFLQKCCWVRDNFGYGKKYDYKSLGPQYENFGNYHYGLYTDALGLPLTFVQAMAGAAGVVSSGGTPSWDNPDGWYDDPKDQENIGRGHEDEW